MTVEIEKNIPLPGNKLHFPEFPYEEMEVGDSFVAPVQDGYTFADFQSALITNAKQWAKKTKSLHQFKSAREGDGIRIWRVK